MNTARFLGVCETSQRTKWIQMPFVEQIQCGRTNLMAIAAKLTSIMRRCQLNVTDDPLVVVFAAARTEIHGIFIVRHCNIIGVRNYRLTIHAHFYCLHAAQQTFCRAKLSWFRLDVFHINERIGDFYVRITLPTPMISMIAFDRFMQTLCVAKVHQMPLKNGFRCRNHRIACNASTNHIQFALHQ